MEPLEIFRHVDKIRSSFSDLITTLETLTEGKTSFRVNPIDLFGTDTPPIVLCLLHVDFKHIIPSNSSISTFYYDPIDHQFFGERK